MGHALTTEPAFQAWIKTERPLLLLAGQNWLGDSQTELNWSSYAILLIIEGCEQKRAEFLLSGLPGPTPVVSDVVRHLVYQLAAQHPEALWHLRNDIEDAVQSQLWQHDDDDMAFGQMSALLVPILTAFDIQTEITIVIYRLDRCRWANDPADDRNDLDIAVLSLLSVLRDGKLRSYKIKMAVVMDAMPAKRLLVRPMIRQHASVKQQKIDWDQEVV
ncbi:hypothetical protein CLAFUW4_10838 [Fulvia fulva]|uniref:Uncharacterized protein n=1 Tax=Passalora fulva TaxID=5499 RepID=A0A9Q8URM1_PASFU|nr:uncharacterized protein CLAFUR5_09881 [Fulvia fulva]KAK4619359.1 hypothetical protein CLAFUR4_10843 [Fulvia fulva]KAK4620314.1 hypothetical protein CLAFUR0_10850 [Fulvia fulva]UJO19857.1 hypothetical protein CLAFUR5_09881 [Fulvia fulva]WPV17253.1 hypothetical protein CLAFUW4_10838 [Fulvia fulva]WPV32076.1 hypothetical protein CLAFUW7_10836 [Fulvia fulva]